MLAEPSTSDPQPTFRRVTYAELYQLVADLVSALLSYGLKPGDRVASYSSNCVVRSPNSEGAFLNSILTPLNRKTLLHVLLSQRLVGMFSASK